MGKKLLSAFNEWPHGTVALTRWFEHQSITRALLASYKKTGWIRSLGHGAYVRADDRNVDWTGAVYALQKHCGYTVYPGARTALELYGMIHYIRLGWNTVYLLSPDKQKNFIPSWFQSFENETLKVVFVQSKLFSNNFRDLQEYQPKQGGFTIQISSLEQALLEMLSLVNRHMDLDEAFKIFEFVRTLDSVKMSLLLRKCTSVKAKRLFMVMATQLQMQWLKEIDLTGVDFGSGSRSVAPGGHFDKRYSITVPNEWFEKELPEF